MNGHKPCEAGNDNGFVCERGPCKRNRKTGLHLCLGHEWQLRRGVPFKPLRDRRKASDLDGRTCSCCGGKAVRWNPDSGEPLCSARYQRLARRGWKDDHAQGQSERR